MRSIGQPPERQRGFNLIELLIVVAVIGIIMGIAYPMYQQQADQSRRADAQRVLMETANRLERCYTQDNSYEDCLNFPVESQDGHYVITEDNASIQRSEFELVATPQGMQADRDGDRCATFTINHAGQRSATGNLADDCWGN